MSSKDDDLNYHTKDDDINQQLSIVSRTANVSTAGISSHIGCCSFPGPATMWPALGGAKPVLIHNL